MSRTGTLHPAALALPARLENSKAVDALVLEHPGRLSTRASDTPAAPGPGEVLVRVHRVGVCDTDLQAYRGRHPFFTYPQILGHELGVEILEVGTGVENVDVGDRCAVEPYLSCGHCVACRHGKPNCCAWLQVMGVHVDGGMRRHFVVPAEKLYASSKLSFDQLALVEPLAVAAHSIRRAALQPDETVAVVGADARGLAVIQFAQLAGCRVIAIDSCQQRLKRCREYLGLPEEDLVETTSGDAVDQLLELTCGELPMTVFDTTGTAGSMLASFAYPAHGGQLVFAGLFSGDVSFHDPSFQLRELSLLASRNAHPQDFEYVLQLMEDGMVDPAAWITHRTTLHDTAALFEAWAQSDASGLKAMIHLT
ncbi:MAG TPA: zinc-binding alcohol dehydrogenase family protein [Opitutaceae bacterium]|nr:zinc-binding alcohol dehydrogenase family protein [Opitutaceae bacterium]